MTIASYTLSPQWAFQPWLVVLVALLAAALVIYLYRAQRSIASRAVVVSLTTLRLLLVLLMFALLAGLSVQWSRTASSGGTLWLLVDNSASMSQPDPRATPVEKLRWADALGFLPAGYRPGKLDRHAARLAALKADLSHLRSVGEMTAAASGGRAGARETADYAAALRAWGDRLRALADDLSSNAEIRKAGDATMTSLREAAARANEAAGRADAGRRREEVAKEIPWAEIAAAVDAALAAVAPFADAADAKLLAEKSSDPMLKTALEKVSALTRAQLAQFALGAKPPTSGPALSDLFPRQETKVLTFADAPQPVGLGGNADLSAALKSAAAAPSGQSTNLAAALRHVHDHLNPDDPASVVLLSDGRHNNGGDVVEPARLLASRGVRVFTLAFGSTQVAADATVEQLDAPDWVYHDDTLRASALLRLDGLANRAVVVDFYRGDAKIDSRTITPTGEHTTQVVHFTDKPPEAGVFEYDVRVAPLPEESVKENNRLGARVAVKKDKLAVLVVEDMPRWEYRHLVNYLSRDQRVKLQTVLLQPARVENVGRPTPVRASPKNEGVEAQLLPQRPQDWAAFDLIVLGDVPKEALSDTDQRNLAAAVRDGGTTLLLIAGPFNMPQRFAGAPLEGLVPVELNGEWSPEALAAHLKGGFRPMVAPEGQASILSQFTIDESENASLWSALPTWYWHSALTIAKRSTNVVWTFGEQAPSQPPAEASARGHDPNSDAETDDPARNRALLCTMSVGMGRVMYLASDSTWRMRQVNGQNPHERFWGQVIRWVVDSELPAGGKLARFGTDKPRYVAGEPVVVTARLLGEDFSPLAGQKLKVVARATPVRDTPGGARPGESKAVAEAELLPLPDAPGYYRATLTGLPAGRVELSLLGDAAEQLLAKDPAVAQKTLTIDVQSHLSVEQRNVNADRAAMGRIAEASGGVALDGPYADVLAASVPTLNYQTERVEQAGLFNAPTERYARASHWAFLAAFVVLAGAEWIIRKSAGLV